MQCNNKLLLGMDKGRNTLLSTLCCTKGSGLRAVMQGLATVPSVGNAAIIPAQNILQARPVET